MSGAIDAIEETVTAGNSGLQYDAVTTPYTYVWKTQKTWGGLCKKFSLELADGSARTAYFQLIR